MNLVGSSLRRPITVMVLVIAIVLGAGLAVHRMARDIFPTLGIPTIYVAQPYGGMDPAQMEGYLTYYYEISFPLHHRHRACGVAIHPGGSAAQTAVSSRH
jgi:Cu/Ag efflux pump CusA